MRFIPTYVHGVLDYLAGIILIAAPWVLGFTAGGPETWVPVALGAAMLVMSAMTRYEVGLIPAIPMSVHLAIDAIAGLVLAASPWIFGFAAVVWIPHVVLGIAEFIAGLTTQTQPSGRSLFTGQ